jgi:hypothetical protein
VFAWTGLLLFIQPYIYASPTQTYGIGMASACCLAAWTLLHWTFLEQLSIKPTVLQVSLSVITHPMSGVIKVYQRMQRHARPAPSPKASTGMQLRVGRPLVVVDAAGDIEIIQAAPAPVLLTKLWQSVATMLGTCVCYDVGLYLLCALSNGMCNAPKTASSDAGAMAGSAAARFLAVCVFGFAAGSLLPLQMDVMFCCLRSSMYAGAVVWPGLAAYADQLPRHPFNWPAAAKSIGDLWGFRWHQFLRFYFQGLGYTTVDKLLPKGKAVSPGLRWSLQTVAAFFMSGIMHEHLTWAAFGTVTGFYMAFFGLHCAALLLETWGPLILKAALQGTQQLKQRSSTPGAADHGTNSTAPACSTSTAQAGGGAAAKKPALIMRTWAMRLWTVTVMLLLSPLFVEPYRAVGYFAERAWHPFLGVSVTEHVVGWAQQPLHAQLCFAGTALAV